MGISLNNHEDRITELEKGGTMPVYSGEGWYDFPGGLQIRMGRIQLSPERMYTVTLEKAFTNTCTVAYASCYPTNGDAAYDVHCFGIPVSATQIKIGVGTAANGIGVSSYIYYLAIGY